MPSQRDPSLGPRILGLSVELQVGHLPKCGVGICGFRCEAISASGSQVLSEGGEQLEPCLWRKPPDLIGMTRARFA
jgi:hypothetical protein